MIDIKNLSKKQTALLYTLNLFKDTSLNDDDNSSFNQMIISQSSVLLPIIIDVQPDLILGQINKKTTDFVIDTTNVPSELKDLLEDLNKVIMDEYLHHSDYIIFDTVYRWVYTTLWKEYPSTTYTDVTFNRIINESVSTSTIDNRYLNPVNRGQFALNNMIILINTLKKGSINFGDNGALILICDIFKNLNTYPGEFRDFYKKIKDYIDAALEGYEDINKFLFPFIEEQLSESNENNEVLLFDIFFNYYKELYNILNWPNPNTLS